MTITQTTHPDAGCVLLNAFIPYGTKAQGNVRRTMKRNQTMIIPLSTLILRSRIPSTLHNAKGNQPLHHT